jgi:predicted Zn-dependent peptidase
LPQCPSRAFAATFANGLRLSPSECRTSGRSAIGVWLTRGSRHEPEAQRHRALRRAHALQGHGHARTAEDIAQAIDSIGGQLDAFTSKEYAGYYIKVLDEHLPLALDLLTTW